LAQLAASWFHTLGKHTGKLEHGERRLLEVKMVNSIDDIVECQATRGTPVEGFQKCDNKKD
jgi:hypothetical protein